MSEILQKLHDRIFWEQIKVVASYPDQGELLVALEMLQQGSEVEKLFAEVLKYPINYVYMSTALVYGLKNEVNNTQKTCFCPCHEIKGVYSSEEKACPKCGHYSTLNVDEL